MTPTPCKVAGCIIGISVRHRPTYYIHAFVHLLTYLLTYTVGSGRISEMVQDTVAVLGRSKGGGAIAPPPLDFGFPPVWPATKICVMIVGLIIY